VVLLGSEAVGTREDSNSVGLAEAFQYTATASGPVGRAYVRLGHYSSAKRLAVGLYADAAGAPGALLTQGTIDPVVNDAWNGVSLPPVDLIAGERYWIALLVPATESWRIAFVETTAGGVAQTSGQSDLGALPGVWMPGTTYTGASLSAYVVAASGGPGQPDAVGHGDRDRDQHAGRDGQRDADPDRDWHGDADEQPDQDRDPDGHDQPDGDAHPEPAGRRWRFRRRPPLRPRRPRPRGRPDRAWAAALAGVRDRARPGAANRHAPNAVGRRAIMRACRACVFPRRSRPSCGTTTPASSRPSIARGHP
jgi:hypothetical protein